MWLKLATFLFLYCLILQCEGRFLFPWLYICCTMWIWAAQVAASCIQLHEDRGDAQMQDFTASQRCLLRGRCSQWKQRGCREWLTTVWRRCPSGIVVKAPVTCRLVALSIFGDWLTWLFLDHRSVCLQRSEARVCVLQQGRCQGSMLTCCTMCPFSVLRLGVPSVSWHEMVVFPQHFVLMLLPHNEAQENSSSGGDYVH